MLTSTQINSFKPKDKLYRKLDSQGLYIEIAVSGSKIWQQRYYFHGKENMITLGNYPEMSLLDARQARDLNKQLLKQNTNPKEYKAVNANSISLEKVLFKDMFMQWHSHMSYSWSDNYAEDVMQRADKYLLPYIGGKPIASLTSQDMLRLFKQIEEKGIIDTLQKIKGIASRVFRHCVGMGIIDYDPTRDLPADVFKKKKTSHYATITDPKEIGGLLRVIDSYIWSYEVGAALKIAPYVFLRPGELAGLMWREVDFDDKLIRIKPDRMKMKKPHLVPMSKQVIDILQKLEQIETNSDFVFPSARSAKRHITPESLRAGLRRLGLSNDDITTHGFRHMASTRLNELGYKSDVIERQLAHSEPNKIKAAYNHAEHLEERREMMQAWADYLDKLRETQT
jgi:integrase